MVRKHWSGREKAGWSALGVEAGTEPATTPRGSLADAEIGTMTRVAEQPTVLGRLDPVFAWDGERLLDPVDCTPGRPPPASVQGQFAAAATDAAGRTRLVRDVLGLNKLFWSALLGSDVLLAGRPMRLVEAGRAFASIRAIPPGTIVDMDPATATVTMRPLASGLTRARARDAAALEDTAAAIRDGLHRYMALLADAYAGAQVFVCASGGIDSSGVAAFAREHFDEVIAVSFDLRRCGRPGSEDRRVAQRLARDLGLLFLDATATADQLLEPLDLVLVEAVDWRDFNVHAALVHAALARVIAEAAAPDRPTLVLTGDLPNALLPDYTAESHRGRIYYRLPRVPGPALRDLLVRGLDTSNRGVGPFGAWGLPVALPYAAVADPFLALPEGFLTNPRRKADLARFVFGTRIPDYVYARPKRAQLGDEGGGVLGVCVDAGIDQPHLRERFARLHGLDPDADRAVLDRFMRCGRYRAGVPGPQEVVA